MGNITTPHIIFTVTNDLSFDRRMFRICRALAESGFEVTLVGRKLPDSPALEKQIFHQKRLSCWFDKGKLFYLEYNLRLLIYLIFRNDYQAICAIDVDTLWPAVRVGNFLGKKVIFDAHELFHEVPEVVCRPRVQSFWKNLAQRLVPKVDLAYTVGPALAKYFSDLYQIPFHSIRNVPIQIAKIPDYDHQRKVILYQGKVNLGRGVREMILAMEDFPQFEFWILGDGDEYDDLKAMADSLSYSERIKFLGFIAPDHLADYTQQALIGVNLLADLGLSYHYSLANKAFDYIQMGIPSIQMAFPEYQNLQKDYHCFLLLETLSVDGIKAILESIQSNPEQLIELNKQAKMAAKQLNWEKEAPLLIQLYKDLFKKE